LQLFPFFAAVTCETRHRERLQEQTQCDTQIIWLTVRALPTAIIVYLFTLGLQFSVNRLTAYLYSLGYARICLSIPRAELARSLLTHHTHGFTCTRYVTS